MIQTPSALFLEKSPWYPSNRILDGPHCRSGSFGKKKDYFTPARNTTTADRLSTPTNSRNTDWSIQAFLLPKDMLIFWSLGFTICTVIFKNQQFCILYLLVSFVRISEKEEAIIRLSNIDKCGCELLFKCIKTEGYNIVPMKQIWGLRLHLPEN